MYLKIAIGVLIILAFFFNEKVIYAQTSSATPTDQIDKSEAEYQKFIKDHVGYNLLTVTHDKFKNETIIQIDPRMMNELGFQKPDGGGTSLSLSVIASIPDKRSKKQPALVSLLITSTTDDWQYLNCNDFNWLVDDKPFKWLDESYSNDTFTGGVIEDFTIALTPRQFHQLVKSEKIECKICNDEFNFVQKQFWVMRWVDEQLKSILEK